MVMKKFTLLFNEDLLYQKIIDINKSNGMDLNVITEQFTGNETLSPRGASDIERIYHLKKDPNQMYLDADAIQIKDIDFPLEEGYPYLYCPGGINDICVIIGNGVQWFFDYLYSKFDKSNPIQWYLKLINGELKDKIRPIPKGYFLHLAFNGTKIAAKQNGNKIIAYGYSLQLINGEWDLIINYPK